MQSLCRLRTGLWKNINYFANKLLQEQQDRQSLQPNFPANRTESNISNVRPYKEIPGPSKIEMIRGFLPGGIFHDKPFEETIHLSIKKWGSIYRYPGFFGKKDMIAVTDPKDFPIIYRNEGIWPYRRPFEFILYHRNVLRRDFYEDVPGITWSNGEKWGKMRSAVNPILMNPKNAILYFKSIEDVSFEFIERIREIRHPKSNEMPEDFENEIQRLTFETVCSVALNRRLGLIRKNRYDPRASEMLTCIRKFLDESFQLEVQPPFWKIIKTRRFMEMMHTLDGLTEIADSYIKEALEQIRQDTDGRLTTKVGREKSVLEELEQIDHKIAVVTAIDLMMGGVDTTTSTLASILMLLSKNQGKQQKLFEEIVEALPRKDSEFTMDTLKDLPYLKACIKESMRLFPITAATFRQMPRDIVLSGYHIPAGTDVINLSLAHYKDSSYVPRAEEFLPERWLRSETEREQLLGKLTLPFMFIPFGFGPRMCVGKRLVELELTINIARLVRNFEIGFPYSIEKAFKARAILLPQIPLKFTFQERPF